MEKYKISLTKQQYFFICSRLPKRYSVQIYKSKKFQPQSNDANVSDYFGNRHELEMLKSMNQLKSSKMISEDINQSKELVSQVNGQNQKSAPKFDTTMCTYLIKKLKKHESAWPFLDPVNPWVLGIPEYFQIILEPMDLKTIQEKLKNDQYDHQSQFHLDIYKMLMNSYKFNKRRTQVYESTVDFQHEYLRLKEFKRKDIQREKDKENELLKQQKDRMQKEKLQKLQEKRRQQIEIQIAKEMKLQRQIQQAKQIEYRNRLQNQELQQCKMKQKVQLQRQKSFEESNCQTTQKNNSSDEVRKKICDFLKRMNQFQFTKPLRELMPPKAVLSYNSMTQAEKKQLMEKVKLLKRKDYKFIVEIIFRGKRTAEQKSTLQIDFDRLQNKILREIQNFVNLREINHKSSKKHAISKKTRKKFKAQAHDKVFERKVTNKSRKSEENGSDNQYRPDEQEEWGSFGNQYQDMLRMDQEQAKENVPWANIDPYFQPISQQDSMSDS